VTSPYSRQREASTYEVIEKNDPVRTTSHGVYDTLDEARGCVEYDGLVWWEIWQGDHIVDESDGPFRVSPPDELNLLRDGFADDDRVIEESIGEQLRNALQILNTAWRRVRGRALEDVVEYGASDVAAIRARIQNALDLAETPIVVPAEPLARFLDDLASQRTL
jgi:hypothetical protein